MNNLIAALGTGLYKAAPMMNQIDEQRATDAYRQKQDARADASEARTAATYGLMLEDRTEKKAKDAKVAEIMGNWSGNMRQMGEATQALKSGKMSSQDFATAIAPHYSKLIKDGKVLQPLADGSFSLTENDPKANMTKVSTLSADDAAKYLSSSEMFMKARRQMYEELAAVNPDFAAKADSMLGHELEASRDSRNFNYKKDRDATADEQFGLTLDLHKKTAAENARHNKEMESYYRNKPQLTTPQQRINQEIQAARNAIAGMSHDAIRKRTQQYSATGRENPQYDPLLAAKVRQANRRKFGEDNNFPIDPAYENDSSDTGDVSGRFSVDGAMKGMRLGSPTPRGYEVFDANGKLIGHYQ